MRITQWRCFSRDPVPIHVILFAQAIQNAQWAIIMIIKATHNKTHMNFTQEKKGLILYLFYLNVRSSCVCLYNVAC